MLSNIVNPIYYFGKIKDIFRFVVCPSSDSSENNFGVIAIIDFFVITLITLILAVSVNALTLYLLKPELTGSLSSLQQNKSPFVFALLLVLIAPIREELYYRLFLKFAPTFLAVSFAVFCHQLISKQWYHVAIYDTEVYPFSRLTFAMLLAVVFYLIISQKNIGSQISSFFTKYFKWIFWFSCICFACSHSHYFETNIFNTLLMPILILPQLILGLSLGYMRIKYGMIYAALLHMLYNSSYFLMLLF